MHHSTAIIKRAQPVRNALLGAVAARVYVDQQAVLVSNGLSTELLCFPADVRPDRQKFLREKIGGAISYATAFRDVEALNALLHLPAGDANPYLTLGLYLYLADECSRLRPDTTFLSAMREAGAEVKPGDVPDREAMREKVMAALRMLGMEASHGAVLTEWMESGSYTILGVHHGVGASGMEGPYARLAEAVSLEQEYLGMNMAISYALGNKHRVEHLTAAEALALTATMIASEDCSAMRSAIREGERVREARIRARIAEQVPHAPPGRNAALEAEALLAPMPDAALEILYREGYQIAYANGSTVGPVLPDAPLPGNTQEQYDGVRGNKGLLEPRFRTLFICNGHRREAGDVERDDALRFMVAGQSALHETMHIAMRYIGAEERQVLRSAVEALHGELSACPDRLPKVFHAPLQTLDTSTLFEALDYTSALYPRYATDGDIRWLEVVCNLFGLAHTEFAAPESVLHRPPECLPSLARLSGLIDRALDTARERSRAAHPEVRMPKQEVVMV